MISHKFFLKKRKIIYPDDDCGRSSHQLCLFNFYFGYMQNLNNTKMKPTDSRALHYLVVWTKYNKNNLTLWSKKRSWPFKAASSAVHRSITSPLQYFFNVSASPWLGDGRLIRSNQKIIEDGSVDDPFQNFSLTLLYALKTGLMASWTSAAKSVKEKVLTTKEITLTEKGKHFHTKNLPLTDLGGVSPCKLIQNLSR